MQKLYKKVSILRLLSVYTTIDIIAKMFSDFDLAAIIR